MHSRWPRRYLLLGPLFTLGYIVLFFALFIFGIGLSDSIPPHTLWKDRIIDAIDAMLTVMSYPLAPLARWAGDALIFLNPLVWGFCTVGVWHVLSAIGNRLIRVGSNDPR